MTLKVPHILLLIIIFIEALEGLDTDQKITKAILFITKQFIGSKFILNWVTSGY